MTDDTLSSAAARRYAGADLSGVIDRLQTRTNNLDGERRRFRARDEPGVHAVDLGGKQLDDVMRILTLRVSSLAVTQALKPVASGINTGLSQLFGGFFGTGSGASGGGASLAAAMGAIKPFASGGVIGTPTYFPLAAGGAALAGEAGP